jgi:hypothetical protein
MLVLTAQDQQTLRDLVRAIDPDDTEKTLNTVIEGYTTYADDKMITGRDDDTPATVEERAAFFDSNLQRLISNIHYAGKKSEVVFINSRPHIYNTFKRLGIPPRDLEEMADAAIVKFWKFQHAEKYNPLTSAWNHHVYLALSRMAASYWERRQRDPLSLGFAFQQFEAPNEGGSHELMLEPYLVDQDPTPTEKAILDETLQDFQDYLRVQPSYRTGVVGRHKDCCTLLPPGPLDHPITDPTLAYIVRKSDNNSRVELEDGTRPLWPTAQIINIRPNPHRDDVEGVRINRTPLDLYNILMERGVQVDELSVILRVGPSTAHNWVRRLEAQFQEWWCTSHRIPRSVRWMAKPIRKCPGCGYEHTELPDVSTRLATQVEVDSNVHWTIPNADEPAQEVTTHWCDLCEKWSLDSVPETLDLPYPWGQIRGNQDLVERSARYKNKLVIQRCGI